MPRHRHREFLRFLKTIDERTLPNLDLRQSGVGAIPFRGNPG
jgi:hypothetical protein